jgi:hypothetical protein
MKKPLFCSLAAVAALLAGCASAPPATVPAGAQPLSAPEIGAVLARPARFDNGIVGGLTYAFAPDGTVVYSMRALPVRKAGAWKLDGDRLCINVERDPWECGALYRLGPSLYYYALPEYDSRYNTLSLRV